MTTTTKKFTSTVAGASILLTITGLLSRGLGLVREIVFAGAFGLTSQYDLFLVGMVIPITINTIIIYIAQNYFIPNYNRLKTDSILKASLFFRKTILLFLLGGLFTLGLIYSFSGQIIKLYLSNPDFIKTTTAIEVLRIYSFTIPLNAAFSVLAAYLYSEFEFKFPTISQLFINVSIILAVLFFAESLSVISIAVGYLLGIIFQVVFIVLYVVRTRRDSIFLKEQRQNYYTGTRG